jgi:hypothetical protein
MINERVQGCIADTLTSYEGNDLANRKVLDLSGIGVLLKQNPDTSEKQ